jgi:3-oxoacyl-[acyl-carrier protein] reductase
MTTFKRAIVFGASGNIGQAISRQLAADGWSLVMQYYHHEAAVVDLVAELSHQYSAQEFQSVLMDFYQPDQDYRQLLKSFGDYQALIFAQGATTYQLFTDISDERVLDLFRLHLLTPMSLIKAAQPHLQTHEHSRIVLIGSIYGGCWQCDGSCI